MATENTGGWQLTTSTYARGGRMEEVGADGKVTATLNNAATKAALAAPQGACAGRTTRMGSTFDYAWGTINQAFAAGQVGMFTGGSDLYTCDGPEHGLKPEDYGDHDHPARRATRTPASSAAARSRRSTS